MLPYIWAGLSGCLASFAFPRHQVSVIALIALVPLLHALRSCEKAAVAFRMGFLWGVCFFSTVIYWIPEVMIHFGHLDRLSAYIIHALLVGALSCFPALFASASWLAGRRWTNGWWLTVPFTWVALEWVRNCFPLGGFPWGQLGYAMAPLPGFMQSAAVTGIYGPTWMVVLCNTLIAWRSAAPMRGKKWPPIFLALAVLFVVSWLAGMIYLSFLHNHEGASSVEVAVVQANIAFEDDLEPARERFRNYYYPETRKAFERGAQVVVWPESPTPFSYSLQEDYRQQISQLIPRGGGQLIINDITVEERSKESRYFNSALLLDGQGGLLGRYDKNHLVPYGEYIPLVEYLPFIDALTREVGAFTPGILPGLLKASGGPVGAFICYEAAFPEVARACTVGGATWLVNLTNDLWYGNTSAPHQHLQIAMVRAIENRRFLVRAANSGFSALIGPDGKVLVASDLFREEAITGRIYPSTDLSIYAQWGDFFPAACVIITCVWLILGMALRPFRRRSSAEPLSE